MIVRSNCLNSLCCMFLTIVLVVITGCGGGGGNGNENTNLGSLTPVTNGSENINSGNPSPLTETFFIGGTVSGLAAGTSLILQNNGSDNLNITTNGLFTFATKQANLATYNVSVLALPMNQNCTITYGAGFVSGANVTNVDVICKPTPINAQAGSLTPVTNGSENINLGNPSPLTETFFIGGTVSGLATGTSLILQNNGSDNLNITSNGLFTFATKQANLASYNVSVLTLPTNQNCTITYGAGFVSGANVTNVDVICKPTPIGVQTAMVTFNYSGTQLYGIGNTQVSVGDKVTASFTFSSQFAEFGYPAFGDVVAWNVTTPLFTLSEKTGSLSSSFPTPPFVIRNGVMLYWTFSVGNSQVPYKSVSFQSTPLWGTSNYEDVYSQQFPTYDSQSFAVGMWSKTFSIR